MSRSTLILALAVGPAAAGVISCQRSPAPDTAPGVSWELAGQRAAAISDVRYDIRLAVPESVEQPILGQESIGFTLADAKKAVVLDFTGGEESVLQVRVGEIAVEYDLKNDHIVIPATALRQGENRIEIDFLAGENSLNRNRDFLYTLFVPDRARFAFPCFDQPDLKASYRLTLDVPASWQAIANGAVVSREEEDGRVLVSFAETEPLSTYLFAFVAGEFQVEEAERGGRLLRFFHRETDEAKLARNRDAIFDLHATALQWLEEYTGIAYPFGKFEFVLVPAFQYSGMEHPGAILYRDSRLLLDESATQNEKLGRASLIAHETAHMWFGDLVTMKWFDDVWTKEVFANFMAAKIVHPSFPDVNHDLRFLLAHFPEAYEIDRSAGANPIRQPLENLREAGSLYGAIIYQKAPIVMRQLEDLVGHEGLRDGLQEYLRNYAFANATWPDLIRILDARSEGDLAAWSRVWVEEAQRPTITVERSVDEGGAPLSLAISQSDPAGAGRIWPQQLAVELGFADERRVVPIFLDTSSLVISEAQGEPAPYYVLPDGRGFGYGLFQLDDASLDFFVEHLTDLPDALTRGIAWLTLWDAMLEGRIPPGAIIELAESSLPVETDELLVQRVLSYLQSAYWRYQSTAERNSRAPGVEMLLWEQMEGAEEVSLKSAYYNAFRSIALTELAVGRLEALWRGNLQIAGLSLSEQDHTRLAQALAVRQVNDREAILDEQLDRIENPDRREQFLFVRPALSADSAVRDRFFESLMLPENREHEPWVLEALGYLHHPLRAAQAERYILPSLERLEEIQATGDIFFPKNWLDATLSGHNTMSSAEVVRRFIGEHPDYPARLKGKILQSADPLFRAAGIVEGRVM